VRLTDIANKNVSGLGRKAHSVFSQEFPFSFNHHDADLSFYVVRMNGKFLPGPEVEIDDLKIRGVVYQKVFHRLVAKAVLFV
jgi:hypothetical protein